REEKATALEIRGDGSGNCLLLLRDGSESQRPRHGGVLLDHVEEPRGTGVIEVELRVLAGEVFMMEMEPVVLPEPVAQYLRIPDLLELNSGVVERHRDRVIPRRRIGRDIHSNLGCLLQRNRVHVAALDFGTYLEHRPIIQRLDAYPRQCGIAWRSLVCGDQERSVA